jgi:hypothetical protein
MTNMDISYAFTMILTQTQDLLGKCLFKSRTLASYSTLEDHVRNAAVELEVNEVANKREALLSIPGISPRAVDILLRMSAFSGERGSVHGIHAYDDLKKELNDIGRQDSENYTYAKSFFGRQ